MNEKADDEFGDAIPIVKPHRYSIKSTDRGATATFGLLGVDGVNRIFSIDSERVAYLGMEMRELARSTKHAARGSVPHLSIGLNKVILPLTPSGDLAPFVGPELKVHRASVHFEELDDLIYQYCARVQIATKEIERTGQEVTWEIAFSEPPPAAIPLVLGDAIHNLRSSLDHMVCDLARAQGRRADRLKFPFAEDEQSLFAIMKKDRHQPILGDDIADAIVALRPYKKNGNQLLRALHDLDVDDKHKLIIPTYAAAWHAHDMAARIADGRAKANPTLPPLNILFISDEMHRTYFRHGDRLKRPIGEEPMRYYAPEESSVQVTFAPATQAFAHQPLLPSVAKLFALVEEILLTFKTKFIKP